MVEYNDNIITEIKKYMTERGYTEHSDNRINGLIQSIVFIHSQFHFSCIIKPNSDKSCVTFEFRELLVPGAFTLTSNECGSLFNKSHFKKQQDFMLYYLSNIQGGKQCLQI